MPQPEASTDIRAIIREAASLIRSARYLTAFTGAGISVESGIPPFRGPGGLWSRYDPRMLELDYFLHHPEKAWPVLREIFYDHFGRARPNQAHEVLAAWEARGLLRVLITQNIDSLHARAGSKRIIEYHGNSRNLLCMGCGEKVGANERIFLQKLPPQCGCGGILKPDFVFFGEGIPQEALRQSEEAARKSDVMIVVGSTGEVYPAAMVPREASALGAAIIEINPEPSEFTKAITTVFIRMKATQALILLEEAIHQ